MNKLRVTALLLAVILAVGGIVLKISVMTHRLILSRHCRLIPDLAQSRHKRT